MIESKYKNSGISWIGEIPNEWRVDILSMHLYDHCLYNSESKESNLLSLSYGNIVRKNIETKEGLLPENFNHYNIIDNGDIVLRLTDLQNDKRSLRTGLCKEHGIITSAYLTLRQRGQDDSTYLHYLLHTYDLCKVFYGMGNGVRQGMNYSDMRKLLLVIPSLSEQKRIVAFLDEKCNEIDTLVSLQEEMINELKVYTQSLITEAVTKGIDSNVPMKESGIEWIGEIPCNWEVFRTKSLLNSISKGNGITKDEVFEDGDTPCVRYGEIYSKFNNTFYSCVSKTKKGLLSSCKYFSNGDLLCAGTGELVEEIGKSIVYKGSSECLAGGDIIILSPKKEVDSVFLNYALNSHPAQSQKSCSKAKLKVVHISASDIGNVLLPIPPLEEQIAIAKYLDEKLAQINSLIKIKFEKIQELKDYKKSIIFEYVTGKKRV